MIKLELEDSDDEKIVNLAGRSYSFVEEPRGVREKFWLVQAKSKYFKETMKNRFMLFKYNRNDVSCENWGEIYASRIAKQIGIPCVEYHLAEYNDGKTISRGVLCGTYKKNENEVEATAFDVHKILSDKIDNINTVDELIKNLIAAVPNQKDKKFYYSYLRNSLIRQCIFDFLLAQTDRHWFNTTFLMFYNDQAFNLRKADCYDNGCIAFLKRKLSAIEGISKEIKVQGKNSKRLHDLLKDYVPMMGIKTSTVEQNWAKDPTGQKLKVKKEMRNVFLDELTNEILTNPEVARFYIEIKGYLNIRLITQSLEKEKMPPPKAVADMVELVVGHQLTMLETLLQEKLNLYREEKWVEV